MAELTSSAAVAASAVVGITVFGVAIGLHPEHLVAGFWGAVWSLTYSDPMPPVRRIMVTGVSTIVAGYSTPVVVAVATGLSIWPKNLTGDIVQYSVAVGVGFGAHRIIGPAMLKLASKKIEEMTR